MRPVRRLGVLLPLAAMACEPHAGTEHPQLVQVAPEALQIVAPGSAFSEVREIALASDAIWALDRSPPFLTRVPLGDGRPSSIGGRGEGPGEFLNPVAVQSSPSPADGGVLIWDYGTRRLTRLDHAGVFTGSERLEPSGLVAVRLDLDRVSFVEPFRIRAIGARLLSNHYPARVDRSSEVLAGSVREADPRLAPGRVVIRLADHARPGADPFREWEPLPLWDACDGALVLWSPARARVEWLDREGRELQDRSLQLDPGPVGPADIERYLRHMARLELGPGYQSAGLDFKALAATRQEQFAEYRPLATDIRCEGPGSAWIRLFDTEADPVGRARTWVRVPTVGPLEQVTFPTGFRPLLFTPDRVFGAYADPFGSERLAFWRRDATPAPPSSPASHPHP